MSPNRIRSTCLARASPIVPRRLVALPVVGSGGTNSAITFLTADASCEIGSAKFYGLCAVGGILSCGITHTAVVPLDMLKCRIQVNPAKYSGVASAFRVTMAEEGVRALAKGWAPTLVGYSMQGMGKFGLYELFKHVYADWIGEVMTM